MGFIGDGDNIAIVTLLPLLIFVLIAFKYSSVCGIKSSIWAKSSRFMIVCVFYDLT